MKRRFLDFITIFVLVFILTALVSFLYSMIFHSHGVVDWEGSFRFGIIFGIVIPWMRSRSLK
jgi:hypothetical protein